MMAMVALADEKPSLFVPIFHPVLEFILPLMAPQTPLSEHRLGRAAPADHDPDYWDDVKIRATELFLSLAEGYPAYFDSQFRREILRDFVGSQIDARVRELADQMDVAQWAQEEVSFLKCSRLTVATGLCWVRQLFRRGLVSAI
jgi:hypothetical protein